MIPSITLCSLFEFLIFILILVLIHRNGFLTQSNQAEDMTRLSTVIIIQVIHNGRV